MKELRAIVAALHGPAQLPAVLATLVSVEGSSYRRPGARLLVTASGKRCGAISGGCLEEDVLVRAARVRASGQAETVVYDTTYENDLVWGVGLGCHGIVRVLIERVDTVPDWAREVAENAAARRPTNVAVRFGGLTPASWGTRLQAQSNAVSDPDVFAQTVPPPTALAVFGAGEDAAPLVRLAKELGWQVTVADPRAAAATVSRFPEADALVVGPADQLVAQVSPDAHTLAVVMTHHYVHDVPLLRDLLVRPLAYLGLLGPRKRAEKILSDLAAGGLEITPAVRARLHAPVGLDLGADAPEQVALAIAAEMLASLQGRDARPLRERSRPIHG